MLNDWLALSVVASALSGVRIESLGDVLAAIVRDFSNLTSPATLSTFLQVVLIDVVLAGDNAVVVGALAAGLPPQQRRRVIGIGILVALVLRILFALFVTWLLGIIGLIFAGGILLLWVSWKMWRELHHPDEGENGDVRPAKSFMAAAWAVAIADVSMSLDNVLGVAGAAREHPGILIVGLCLSVLLMGVAANLIAKYIERHRWIGYAGLLVIVYVAVRMIYQGIVDPELGLMKLMV